MANFTEIGVEAVVKGVTEFNRNLGKMDIAIGSLAASVVEFAVQSTAKLVAGLVDIGVKSVETAISFESAFAGVIKTTEGLEDETGNLTVAGLDLQNQFRSLAKEVPVAIEELLAIGELGGQLGISKEDLISFTETITAMGVATNLTTEDAAVQFAQIANIMGTVEREGNDAFSKLGSSIVALGNNFATTEADIANFASRIAGAGKIAGLTEADVFGIGAAFSSVGVSAEAGGTAVQKVLLGINKAITTGGGDLETFASVAGLTVDDFAELWEEDAGDAFTRFVNGLGAAGDDAIFILEDLELKDQRLVKAFLSLAGAGDLLNETIALSSDAWDENSALAKEAEQRYATTESQIAIAKNTLKDFGITIGSAVLPFLNDALTVLKPFIEQIGENLPGLIDAFVVPALEGMMGALSDVIGFLTEADFSQIFADLASGDFGSLAELLGLEDFLPVITQVASFVQGVLMPAFNDLVAFFESEGPIALENLSMAWEEVWGFIQEVVSKVIDWFKTNFPLIQETAQTLVNVWIETQKAWRKVWESNILPVLDNVWNIIKATFTLFLDNILQSATLIMQIINGDWEGAWESIKLIAMNIWTAISTIFTEFLEGVLNAFGSNIEEFKAQWSANWELIKTIAAQIWENIKQAIVDTVEGIQKFWASAWESIKETAVTLWTNIVTAITTFIENIRQGIVDKIEEIKAFFALSWLLIKSAAAVLWQSIKDAILEKLRSLFESMGINFDEMIARWIAIWNDILAIGAEIWERIKTAIMIKMFALQFILSELWNAVSTKITEVWDAIVLKVTEVTAVVFEIVTLKIQELSDWWTETWDAVGEKLSEVWGRIVTKVTTKSKEVFDAITVKIKELSDWWTIVWAAISKVVGDTWDAVVLAVTTKAQEIFDVITEKVQGIVDWFSGKVQAFKDAGSGLLQGLIDGVKEKAGSLINAVTGAIEGAIEKAKELLNMESPSKVFVEIGQGAMKGFALGIQELMPEVQATLQAAISPPSASSVMAAGSVMGNTVNQTNNIQATINNGMDEVMFEQKVLNIVGSAVGI